jgi:hypothetical protein
MGAVVTSMDWSPIIAGGITGLLSGAISGNLVQYVLDKRRTRDENRHQLLLDWDALLSKDSVCYDDIITHPSYELLTSFVSSKSRRFLAALTTDVENKCQPAQSEIDETFNKVANEPETMQAIAAIGWEDFMTLMRGATWEQRHELTNIKETAKQALVACLKRELLLLKKKWGMF